MIARPLPGYMFPNILAPTAVDTSAGNEVVQCSMQQKNTLDESSMPCRVFELSYVVCPGCSIAVKIIQLYYAIGRVIAKLYGNLV